MVVYFASRTLLLFLEVIITFLHSVTSIPLHTPLAISALPSNTTSFTSSSLPSNLTGTTLSAGRWPRVPFSFPISGANPDWIWFQRIGSTPPTDYHTRLLRDIIESQITIYKAQPARSNPNPFSVTRSDVRFSMASKAGQHMTMEVALEALVTLKMMVARWGAIRLGFVVGSSGVEVGEGTVDFITDEE